jgi:N-acetyl-gamma-glutamyl-phosphate reductase
VDATTAAAARPRTGGAAAAPAAGATDARAVAANGGAPSHAAAGVGAIAAAGSVATAAAPGSVARAGAPAPAAPARPQGRAANIAVAVLGASGYSGMEFARLALGHPGLKLAALVSREHAGKKAWELLPGLDPRAVALPEVVTPESLEGLLDDGVFDTLVACLPHGAWKAFEAGHPALAERTPLVVDLSSDHRDGSGGYAYGLPEAFRASLPGATRIANPGCYPTAAALALMPAAEQGWLGGPITVHALSGVTGAGRSPALRTSFAELDGGASLYKVGTIHQHVAEMERTLARVGASMPVAFAPQLAPMARGILLTANVALSQPVSPEEAQAAYAARYAGEPFVRVLAPGEWPETRAVRSSNRCDVAVTTLHGGTHLLVAAALDNLVKGAAGQAIQNLNLQLGWPEDWGLPVHGNPW